MFNASFGELKDQYYADIHRMAADIAAAIEEGEYCGEEGGDDLDDAIAVAADNSYYTSHIPEACAVLWVSKHGDFFFSRVGEPDTFDPCKWAFFTVERDIMDALEGMGYDLGNPQPLAEEEEE